MMRGRKIRPLVMFAMTLKSLKAFTLVELMITAYVLLIGISGVLLSYVQFLSSSQSSWDMTVASSHAESILEDMHTQKSLADIPSIDWDGWADTHGFKSLPEEKIIAVFDNASPQLLDITVTVEWQRNKAIKNLTLQTKLAR